MENAEYNLTLRKYAKVSDFLSDFSAVVITGGSSGIGAAFISCLGRLAAGIKIFNLSRSAPKLPECGSTLRHISCDLSDYGQLSSAVSVLMSELPSANSGRILLINNAGIATFGNSADARENRFCESLNLVDVNVRAPVFITETLIPELLRRGGAVLNVASTAAFQPTPLLAVYGASKAFILNWSIALNAELAGYGCRVVAVCPGPTRTKFFSRAAIDTRCIPDKFGDSPEEVAMKALCALAEGKVYKIIGLLNRILITLSGFVPLCFSGRLAYMVMKRQQRMIDSDCSSNGN